MADNLLYNLKETTELTATDYLVCIHIVTNLYRKRKIEFKYLHTRYNQFIQKIKNRI